MKHFFLAVALLLLAVPAFSQTIWTYGGGLNFSKQTLTGPTQGVYGFPLIGGSASPINFQNGEVYLAPQYGLSVLYVIGEGTMTPNSNGSFSFETKGILPGLLAGDGAFQTAPDGGTQVSSGFLGIGAFAPSAFGNLGVGLANRLGQDFHPFLCALFVQSFDVLGPLKL